MAEQPKEYPILWWTQWFRTTTEEDKVVDYCGLPYTCRFTLNRSKYDEAKVIVFHAPSFDPHDVPSIEDVKTGKKSWVLNTLEAPKNFQIKSKWTEIFTHLWSYSFEYADFVQSYFNSGRGEGSLLSHILAKPVYTVDQKNIFREDGLAPIAWIVSSCTSENGRHFYIKQLLKYIKVDIYGHCMKNKEWPVHQDGRPYSDYEVVAPYKFYLSIENTNCNDYVSEKIERPYAVGAVPIIDGPRDYSRFLATNHSSIRLDEFATPEQLALHIHELDRDNMAYLKYLDYKWINSTTPIESILNPRLLETYDLDNNGWGPDERGARCGVCALAHDMAEGTYNFNPNKTIGFDRTCAFKKWAFISWGLEFYWWIIALSILGLMAGVAVIYMTLWDRKKRHRLLKFALKLTPSWIAKGRTADRALYRTHDYSKI
ncbi:glycosyltransferase family 10-domain-containing protein [Gamsiella multidivaricata]|uniref:glycosyltransferase family 10-domain-containing protein n=1 Tax=Gamsiella multidivaricata TaxID=101098 RepID=UPI0022206593|nr:glycosyltransferase family 10-domain-containing protein [Gamsiella multidivaricata]KAG0369191.1 Alpha-(1,3)-fucosyltransferase 11 [Gamsiella multidivaricata]KAI7827654.1 glycosyltransferase family 10-domain-containing protein [Gamsiella multidivaricata]